MYLEGSFKEQEKQNPEHTLNHEAACRPPHCSVTVPETLRLEQQSSGPRRKEGVALVMTLLWQSPHACKSRGAGGTASQGGTEMAAFPPEARKGALTFEQEQATNHPGQALSHKTSHHTSCFPTNRIKMPSRAGGQVQGNSPHAARRGWHHVSSAPTAALPHGVPAEGPSPVLLRTPGCFFLAHDLPDLLNKPPSSSKPAAFLVGKVVKCSNRC